MEIDFTPLSMVHPVLGGSLSVCTILPATAQGQGVLTSARTKVDEVAELFRLAKVEQLDNGARHSFISYRCAKIRNVAKVADEVGNSPGTIKKHYREIVTTAAATKYFAIRPARVAANITGIEAGRAIA